MILTWALIVVTLTLSALSWFPGRFRWGTHLLICVGAVACGVASIVVVAT